MRFPKLTLISVAVICFSLGLCLCAFGPQLLRGTLPTRGSEGTEQTRVTSPDGQFDAVLTLFMYGGGPGGIDWNVSIVRRGVVVRSGLHPVFSSSKMGDGKLLWKQPRLLEIQYDVADIDQFRNVWCSAEVEDVGGYGQRDYCVEVRLAPTAPDFSALTPQGAFRQLR